MKPQQVENQVQPVTNEAYYVENEVQYGIDEEETSKQSNRTKTKFKFINIVSVSKFSHVEHCRFNDVSIKTKTSPI